MKHGFTLLLFTVCLTAYAQTDFRFADSTAQWVVLAHVTSVDFGPFHVRSVYKIDGDVIVNGEEYQKVGIYESSGQGKYDTQYLQRDSTGKVYTLPSNQGTKQLLYDLSLGKGDTTTLYVHDMQGWMFVSVTVDSVDSLYIGKWRKRQFLTSNCGFDIVIDGIGSTHKHLFGPICNIVSVDDADYALLCYHEESQLLYVNPQYNSCVFGLDRNLKSSNDIRVEHFNGEVELTFQSRPANGEFSLYDLAGRRILQKELTEQTTRIDVSAITKGVYLYRVVSQNAREITGKVIIN